MLSMFPAMPSQPHMVNESRALNKAGLVLLVAQDVCFIELVQLERIHDAIVCQAEAWVSCSTDELVDVMKTQNTSDRH